jgi:hypothetical protein
MRVTSRIETIRSSIISRSESALSASIRITRRIQNCKLHSFISFRVSKSTEDFIVNISKTLDGRSFTLLIKYLNELRIDVLDNPHHKLTPDSFLIFLDKVKDISHSSTMNDLIFKKIVNVNVDELKAKRMLNLYQQHSFDFRFEENLRLGEIRQFA